MFDGGLLYRGNITNISGVTYVYDEVGKLVSVSENGTTTNITYDVSGNPLTYHNGMSFQWEMGRQLAGITNGNTTISYTYNEDGIRTSKTVNCVTTEYTLVDGRITYQTNGTTSMYFRYDGDDELIGIEYAVNGVTNEYYYVKNLQGDIIDILDNNGNVVVSYEYDAWGEILSVSGSLVSTVGQANPFRYRSYYYDNESGFYYLQSRYYDAGVRRFINADAPEILGLSVFFNGALDTNIYVYCSNNPIMYVDSLGYWAQYYSGFSWTNNGFNVYVHVNFLSRDFCISYAKDIVKLKGKWYWWGKGYKNMSVTRIAQELWAHAVAYFISSPIKGVFNKIGISSKVINDIKGRAIYIQVDNADNRAWAFSIMWWSADLIINSSILGCGRAYPYYYLR